MSLRGNNILGIIFSNTGEELLRELTEKRTLSSVPFGGRYRLIDFPLSNMVNSGINKVAVLTRRNYQSLMWHLGTGKSWGLSKKRNGLFIFPPFGNSNENFTNKIEMLSAISNFIENSKEEYVLLADCDVICNIDYNGVIAEHIKTNADITTVYSKDVLPKQRLNTLVLALDNNKKITQIDTGNDENKDICNLSMNIIVLKRELLISLINECTGRNKYNFNRDILQSNVSNYNIYGYEFKGFNKRINSMSAYFETNMCIMDKAIRDELFDSKRPIYTKVRDDMPARYGLESRVKNSLVGNGCIIEGEVENSVIFKGVRIGKKTKVSNCVVMQDTVIGENCNLNYIIADKDIKIMNERILMGFKSYPVYISKSSVV